MHFAAARTVPGGSISLGKQNREISYALCTLDAASLNHVFIDCKFHLTAQNAFRIDNSEM